MSARLRLVAREPGLDLSVGAFVVYGSHGVGRVSARNLEEEEGPGGDRIVLEFQSGLSVILPVERAESLLRPPAGASEIEGVRAALCARDVAIEQSWQVRTKATRTKIAAGDPVGLAEIVRDGVERLRQSATRSTLSPAEHDLYQKARRLLVAELVVAAGIDEVEAGEWIDAQLRRDTD